MRRAELEALLERVRRRHAPEPRHAVFNARLRRRAGRFLVRVETSEPSAASALDRALRRAAVSLRCVLLPDSALGSRTRGIVRVALAPVRRHPNVRAELVSQEVLGAVLEPLRREGDWLLIRGEDHYLGWVHEGALVVVDPPEAESWRRRIGDEGAVAMDAVVADERGRPLLRAPWGARLLWRGRAEAELPDGRRGRLISGRVVPTRELARRFPPAPASAAETALSWVGVPYLWGGRTRWGADCSGFVQAVFALHGAPLPRDSDLQARSGRPVRIGRRWEEMRRGDLVFFRSAASRRISHVALCLGGSRILHAAESNGEIAVDDLRAASGLGSRLASRVMAVRRVWSG